MIERNATNAKMIAKRVVEEKFSDAQVAFCAGSIVRGEGTATSDIDLVVVFPHLEKAWRESFVFDGWPVEAFVHDPSTLQYFFQESDAKTGIPSLPQMVVEGLLVRGDETQANKLKDIATRLIDAGPAPLSSDEIRNCIYGITDLLDDLKAPKSRAEAVGIGVRLYDSLGDFILRSERLWSGNGKQISRALARQLPQRHAQFVEAFEELFAKNSTAPLLKLADEILRSHGGPLFDGYRREAPASWRLPTTSKSPPILRTQRLVIRIPEESDASAIIQYFKENETRFAPTDPPKPAGFYTSEFWRERIRKMHQGWKDELALNLFLFERNTNEVVGTVSFTQMFRLAFQACYLGYGIGGKHEGKGLMAEALEAAIRYVFEDLNFHRIMANHLPENERSARVLKRLGFVVEGTAKDYLFINGQWRDHVLNALSNPRWRQTQ